MSGKPLTSRDYKGAPRGGLDLRRWQQFGTGLGLGLLCALVVYVSDHRSSAPHADEMPTPRRTASQASNPASAAVDTPRYDFYTVLPKSGPLLPEKDRDVRHVDPAAPIQRPGTYFLQAGSYNNEADAERVRTQLSRQGIEAAVQHVQVDADSWFRVRIGPLKDLDKINATRRQLHSANIDSLVMRVGD
ncbi:MAG TPA: SPOR domain-containing protein [Steroidobacteraceae bacterium]